MTPSIAKVGIEINSQHLKQDLTLYVDRHIWMIHTSISGRCELATIYQRRIK